MQSFKMRLYMMRRASRGMFLVACVVTVSQLAMCCAVASASLRRESRWLPPCIMRHVGVACVVTVPQCCCNVFLCRLIGHLFESSLGTRLEVK